MNLEQARTNMVEQQIRTWEVLDQDVLDLLYTVPREEFVPPSCRNLAFTDMEIPIGEAAKAGCGRRRWRRACCRSWRVRRSDRVLEVGTGSGYLTALLAHRAAQVYSVEIEPALAAFGKANIARHGVDNVTLEIGDGARGYAQVGGPTTSSCSPARCRVLPRALLESLAPGGRAFAVVGEAPVMTAKIVTCSAPGRDSRTVELFETLLAPLANCEQPSRFTF